MLYNAYKSKAARNQFLCGFCVRAIPWCAELPLTVVRWNLSHQPVPTTMSVGQFQRCTLILHAALYAKHTLGRSISPLPAKRPHYRVRALPKGRGMPWGEYSSLLAPYRANTSLRR
jgi:hypothetical protein